MKKRNGFVSNSSSTSFTFIFKGDTVQDLSKTIQKYGKCFDLEYMYWDDNCYSCNAQDVSEAIEAYIDDPKNMLNRHDKVSVILIDDYIEVIIKEIKESTGYRGYVDDLKKQLVKIQSAKKKGLTSVLNIEFGDNDGDISGGDLGYCMDYEGRYISIDKKDFIVYTEQNR